MKRVSIVLVVLVSILAVLSLVSANVCDDNQTIMRISTQSNAHGALWNQTYGIKICYDSIFTPSYESSNPHSCNSNDVVLTLSEITNAHAAGKTVYPVNVCYGGLSDCVIDSSGGCSGSGRVPIVYISGNTNAHLSSVPQIGYSAVCCRGEGSSIAPTPPSSACYELDRQSCENEQGTIARGDPGCPSGSSDLCRCSWNSTGNKCALEYDLPSGLGGQGCSYKCVIDSSEQTTCSGGSKVLSLAAKLVPSNTNSIACLQNLAPDTTGCKSSSAIVPCGSLEDNLPFFGFWQIPLCIAALALIYAVYNRRSL